MLHLVFALIMPVLPAHVDAYHGSRREIVFTQGATVTARRVRRYCTPDAPAADGGQRAQAIRAELSADDNHGPITLGCETLGPRVDGNSVTVCGGRVVSMTDASGYTLAYPGMVR